MPCTPPWSLSKSFTVLLYSISGLLYYHCFFFLSITEDYIAIYDHCNVSLSFSNTNSLSWNRSFLPVPMYQCLSICTSINLAIFVVKFPFVCVTVVLTIIWLFLQDSDPLQLILPLKPTPWATVKTAKWYRSPQWLSESPPWRKCLHPPQFKRNCCHLIFQPHSSYASIYLTWWFSKLEDIRCSAEVQIALFHLLHEISYGRMVLNFGRVSCLYTRCKLLMMNL